MRDAVGDGLRLLNGRAGLELTDNYRAGVDGMIPGIETVDLQVAVARAMREGDEVRAESALSPAPADADLHHAGPVAQFVTYGKLIAALRLGLDPGAPRAALYLPFPRAGWPGRGALAADLGPAAQLRRRTALAKITDVRTTIWEWVGPVAPMPPHFCTTASDLVTDVTGSIAGFRFLGWLVVEIELRRRHRGHRQRGTRAARHQDDDRHLPQAAPDRDRPDGQRIHLAKRCIAGPCPSAARASA